MYLPGNPGAVQRSEKPHPTPGSSAIAGIAMLFLLLALGFGTAAGAQPDVPKVECTYGVPAHFKAGILSYPDFTIRHRQKSELLQTNGSEPWVIHEFEVLDRESRTIGGDISFNSEKRANGRRFDVHGKLYIAEMFSSTATPAGGNGASGHNSSNLPQDSIVIWDEAMARQGNHALLAIWSTEKLEMKNGYFPQQAFANGILLPGFMGQPGKIQDNLSRLTYDSLHVEKVTVARDEPAIAVAAPLANAYGAKVSYQKGTLKYPDLNLRLVARSETNVFDARLSSISYEFIVYDRTGQRNGGFRFSTHDCANGRRFEVDGKTYFAEMFLTTVGLPGPEEPAKQTAKSLSDEEMIVWDETTAKTVNPRILPAWSMPTNTPSGYSTVFAAGTRLTSGFTGTYFIGTGKWCQYAELDVAPTIVHRVPIAYPKALSGSGFVGHVGGYLIINDDGSVAEAVTTHGNETMFQGPSRAAFAQWRFSPPLQGFRPVKALVNFDCDISEFSSVSPEIRFR